MPVLFTKTLYRSISEDNETDKQGFICVFVCVHAKSSHCYYLARDKSFTGYTVQRSNNLNAIRAASR